MSSKSRYHVVRVLLIISGLLTIGLGVYSIKLELSLSQQSREPLRPLPPDLSKFSQDELIAMRKSIEAQRDKEQAAYRRDEDTRHTKRIVSWLMIMSGTLIVLLTVLNGLMMRNDRAKAGGRT